jgi:hypothetical protein
VGSFDGYPKKSEAKKLLKSSSFDGTSALADGGGVKLPYETGDDVGFCEAPVEGGGVNIPVRLPISSATLCFQKVASSSLSTKISGSNFFPKSICAIVVEGKA